MQNNEVLLKVDHLCQYFRLGRKDLKAVDDVNFEIKKGESFGLVGESGCGKTTTGRSIIKLYDITSGNVYFKGERIGAGIRSYQDAISKARAEASKKIKALRAETDASSVRKAQIQEEIKKINKELGEVVDKNRALIRGAKSSGKDVDKRYVESLLKALKDAGYVPKHTIRLILGLDEETGSKGMEYYFSKVERPDFGFTPDAEFPLINGEKGILTFELAKKFWNMVFPDTVVFGPKE